MPVTGLAVMARTPRRGQVKTRLAATIGDERALIVYHRLLRHVRSLCESIPHDWRCRWFLSGELPPPPPLDDLPNWQPQQGADLGARMRHAFDAMFAAGCAPVLMIGTDCPQMNLETLNRMATELRTCDVVLVPAHDGGYVAIGLKRPSLQLFVGPRWGGPDVLETTLKLARSAGLSLRRLPAQTDLDDARDLSAFPWLQPGANAN